MRNISGLLLLISVSFFNSTKLGATGFPTVEQDHIIVEMGDRSLLGGPLKEKSGIPGWLQPKQRLNQHHCGFILKKSGEGFVMRIKSIDSEPADLRPTEQTLEYGPRYAEIFSGSDYLTARHFNIHERTIEVEKKRNVGVMPLPNYVYIQLSNGIIYASMLEPYQASHRLTREEYLTPGHPLKDSLSGLDISSGRMMPQNHHTDLMNGHGMYSQPQFTGIQPLPFLDSSSSHKFLQPLQTNHGEYQGVYPTQGFTRMDSVSTSAASGSKRTLDSYEADHKQHRTGYFTPRLPKISLLIKTTPTDSSNSLRSTCGFPELRVNSMVVEMGDGSHFQGRLKEEGPDKIPSWLSSEPGSIKDYRAFIIRMSNARFSLELKFIKPKNKIEHNLDYGPKYAEILSGTDHLTAKNFVVHGQTFSTEGNLEGVRLSLNRVYVSSINGKIYSSALETNKPGHRENRARVQRQGSPEWGQFSDLDDILRMRKLKRSQ